MLPEIAKEDPSSLNFTTAASPETDAASALAASATLGTTNGLADILYPTDPDGSPDISVADINQGTLGDCYFLAALGEIAIQDPSAIADMITTNPDGTETVTLWEDTDGQPIGFGTTSAQTVQITVENADFSTSGVNSGVGDAVSNDAQVIWPQVLENAFATLGGGYAAIGDGGSPVLALETLTGQAASWYAPGDVTAVMLATDWAAGDLVVFDTPDYGDFLDTDYTYNLIGAHAYMFDGLSTAGGVTYVDLLNPWGTDQPDQVPLAALAGAFDEIDVGALAPPVPPVIAGTQATMAATDRGTATPFVGATITAAAATQVETVTVTLSSNRDGVLSDTAGGTVSLADGSWTASGTAAEVTAELEALVFTPTAHLVAPGTTVTTTLSLTVADTQGTASTATTVATTDLLDPIVLGGLSAGSTITDATTASPFAGMSISDPDAGQSFLATVALSDAADGALFSALGGSFDAATGIWSMDGSIAAVTAAVEKLVFTPTAHQVAVGGSVTTALAMTITGSGGAAASAVATVTATAAENAPKLAGTTATLAATDTNPVAVFGKASIVEPDAGAVLTATVQASGLDGGTLSDALGGTIGSAGTWSISGDAASVTAALDALVYTPGPGASVAGTTIATAFALDVTDTTGGSAAAVTGLTVQPMAASAPAAGAVTVAADSQMLGWFGNTSVGDLVDDGTVSLAYGAMTVATVDSSSDGAFVLGSDATLELGSITGASASISFLAPNDALIVDHAAAFGTGIGTASYAGPTLANFAAGDVIDLKDIAFSAGLTPVYDATTGILQISNGVSDVASLAFAATTLGAGIFHIASDQAQGILVTRV